MFQWVCNGWWGNLTGQSVTDLDGRLEFLWSIVNHINTWNSLLGCNIPLHRSGWICVLWSVWPWQQYVPPLCLPPQQRSSLPSSSCVQTSLGANRQHNYVSKSFASLSSELCFYPLFQFQYEVKVLQILTIYSNTSIKSPWICWNFFQ